MVQGERLDSDLPLLRWNLEWLQHRDPEVAPVDATVGVLTISMGAEEVWGPEDGDWPWIDLLQWLVKSWPWLRSEDGMPAPLDSAAGSLRDLVDALEDKARFLSPVSRQNASMALWNFRETHDLSRALVGADAPPLMIWREGLLAHVLTDEYRYTTRWPWVLETLNALGDAIVQRIEDLASTDDRSAHLIAKWHLRDEEKSARILAIARKQDAPNVMSLPSHWDDVDLGPIETSPVLAAARMTGRLSVELADTILKQINELPYRETSIDLIATSVVAQVTVDEADAPYEQAYRYASEFRSHIELADGAPFAPDSWLANIGVLVRDIELRDSRVEAIAAWGPRNGPAILINRRGVASRSVGGRNASLAHEIGHLVMDRSGALPAAEVLAGGIDSYVESRARAFAAEVLLPRSAARVVFSSVADEQGARVALNALSRRYGVSRELAARQVENSGVVLRPEVFEFLRAQTWRR